MKSLLFGEFQTLFFLLSAKDVLEPLFSSVHSQALTRTEKRLPLIFL